MSWEKIEGAPGWLEVRRGARKTSYRVNYRKDGINLVKTLKIKDPRTHKIKEYGDDWKKARKDGDDLIAKVRVTGVQQDPNLVRCEELLDEMVEIVKSKADATYKQKEIMARVHLKPWLNSNCAYAKDLNSTTWDLYRAFKRRQNPNVTLKPHAEVFGGLCAYALKKGILKQRVELDYDRERDDFKEDGLVIPNEDLLKMLRAYPPEERKGGSTSMLVHSFESWRDRIILQRATGMRPGEVRLLKKDRVIILGDVAVIRLRKEDTKTRQARPVPVRQKLAVEILKMRMEGDDPYLFESFQTLNRPYGPNLKGWRALLKRAGVNPKYTPHDLRHTYLSDMFKNSNNPALICFTCGLSLEEAQKTYLHFSEDDAMLVSNEAARRLGFINSLHNKKLR